MGEVTVVGHQPQYLPYIGILNKISKADIYIIVDHVQFRKKYFHNRTYIKVNDQALLLTVPVLSKGKYKAAISGIEINHQSNWVAKHLKSFRYAYSKAPFFRDYYETIENILTKKHKFLSDLTSELLIFFLEEFDLVKDIRFSNPMALNGKKTELLIELTRAVNGDVYISGEGAKDYFDEERFSLSGLKHIFSEFSHPKYPQQGRTFLEGMGCIDLLFNCGKDGRKHIIWPEKYL